MKLIKEFYIKCWPLCYPLTAIIILTQFLYFFTKINFDILLLISWCGTLLAVLFAVIYIIAKDSKFRWPNTTWYERIFKLFTFQR